MRQRTELAIALGVSAALVVIAFASGSRARPRDDLDRRASTFNTGREGARALADVAQRVGLDVTRWRARPQQLSTWIANTAAATDTTTVAVLAPIGLLTGDDREAILRLATQEQGANLVLAGRTVNPATECLGYRVEFNAFDSTRVASNSSASDSSEPFVHDYLNRFVPVDESEEEGASDERDPCPALEVVAQDTLLSDRRERPLVIRLRLAPHNRSVVLVSDDALVRNRTLRNGGTRGVVVDALLPRSGRIVFDEYHQGYGEGGSMAGAVLDWSRRNPFGWMVWQWCALGLLALLAGAVRFGPVRTTLPRARRSSLEHVRALATALAASRGHRTAVGAMVRGLQRRLAPGRTTPAPARDDWERYLTTLRAHAPNPKVQASAAELARLADHPESDTAVLSAAHAVEDLWNALRP